MASDPGEEWNAAAICQALACPGCFDCRDDNNDHDWDGKDEEPETPHGCDWACTNPHCGNDTPHPHPGNCPHCDETLHLIGPDGHEVTQ